jgi:hypothetical protein
MPLDATDRTKYSLIIQPNNSEPVVLHDLKVFRAKVLPDIVKHSRFGKKLSLWLVRGIVYTDDGTQFRATLGD